MNHAAWYWQENFFPWFTEKGFDCFALSYRNHGNSYFTKHINFTSLNDYLDDIYSITKQFNEHFIFIGHSMGGLLTQLYLEKYKAKAAILLTPVPYNGIKAASSNPSTLKNIVGLFKLLKSRSIKSFMNTPEKASLVMYSKDISGKKLNKYYKKIDEESILAYLQMANRKVNLSENHKIPMLVLAAEKDRLLSVQSIKATAQFYDADFLLLKNTAHNAMLDTRWENTAEQIFTWLINNKSKIL